MTSTIISLLTTVGLILYITYEKIILPKMSASDVESARETVDTVMNIAQKFELIYKMADKFVILAKKKFSDGKGEEKKNWVIEQLKKIADTLDLVLTDEDYEAINESAYVDMKKDEATK